MYDFRFEQAGIELKESALNLDNLKQVKIIKHTINYSSYC